MPINLDQVGEAFRRHSDRRLSQYESTLNREQNERFNLARLAQNQQRLSLAQSSFDAEQDERNRNIQEAERRVNWLRTNDSEDLVADIDDYMAILKRAMKVRQELKGLGHAIDDSTRLELGDIQARVFEVG